MFCFYQFLCSVSTMVRSSSSLHLKSCQEWMHWVPSVWAFYLLCSSLLTRTSSFHWHMCRNTSTNPTLCLSYEKNDTQQNLWFKCYLYSIWCWCVNRRTFTDKPLDIYPRLLKGTAFHWDLMLTGFINILMSCLGLPWMHAAFPHSSLHARQLAKVEQQVENGHLCTTWVKLKRGVLCPLGQRQLLWTLLTLSLKPLSVTKWLRSLKKLAYLCSRCSVHSCP